MTNTKTIYNMPSTCDQLTCEQIDAWLASRKEAGRVIDIETCELSRGHVNLYDPYGVRSDLMEKEMLWEDGITHRVRSAESRGWISEDDLPPDKQEAMRDRFKRMHRASVVGV